MVVLSQCHYRWRPCNNTLTQKFELILINSNNSSWHDRNHFNEWEKMYHHKTSINGRNNVMVLNKVREWHLINMRSWQYRHFGSSFIQNTSKLLSLKNKWLKLSLNESYESVVFDILRNSNISEATNLLEPVISQIFPNSWKRIYLEFSNPSSIHIF